MTDYSCEHQALQARIHASLRGDLSEEEFNVLALTVHEFQRRTNPPLGKWCKTQPAPRHWQDIPAIPLAAFKTHRISCLPIGAETHTFLSSGTTGETRARHLFRDLSLYHASVRSCWHHVGLPALDAMPVFLLSPAFADAPHSSLSSMWHALAPHGVSLIDAHGKFHTALLEEYLRRHSTRGRPTPIALLGTTLAFIHFFETRPHFHTILAPGSLLIHTGGNKGSGRTIAPGSVQSLAGERLGLAPEAVWIEYGMCEMSSPFFAQGDAPLRSGPWSRVRVVNPTNASEVAIGESGVIRIVDLANLHSAIAMQTSDIAVRTADGFYLLGRSALATPRGCSRAADEALRGPQNKEQPPIVLHAFSHKNTTRQRAEWLAAAATPFLNPVSADALLELVSAELGSPDALDQWVPHGAQMTRAIAPRTILHITSRNTPAAALQSLLRGLLLGSHNLCKLPSGGLPQVFDFVSALPETLRASVEIAEQLPSSWIQDAEAIIAFGSNETVDSIRKQVRGDQTFLAYGHRWSCALIWEDTALRSVEPLAHDASIFDQQGCLSPQVVFVRESANLRLEDYATALAEAMAREAAHNPPPFRSIEASHAVESLREEVRFAIANGAPLQLHADPLGHYTVIVDRGSEPLRSPLHRVLILRAYQEKQSPLEALSTVGVWPLNAESRDCAMQLGATRICPIGKMQTPPWTWHQDGRPVLSRLVRWIDSETPDTYT